MLSLSQEKTLLAVYKISMPNLKVKLESVYQYYDPKSSFVVSEIHHYSCLSTYERVSFNF